LKGLESLDLLVGGLHSVTPVGLIIVHYHRIDAQFDHFGLRKLQSPEEKLLKKSAEEPNPKPGKCLEKTLHGVGGKQCLPFRLNGGRITGVFLQGIEVDEMPAGTVQKKAEQLLENLHRRLSFITFSNTTKQPFEMRIELDIAHIANKKVQSSTGGENIRSRLDCINLTFTSTVILGHNDLLPFGFALNQKTISKISF